VKPQPPSKLLLRWCASCNRDDRLQKLTDHHNWMRKKCVGPVLTIEYSQGDVV